MKKCYHGGLIVILCISGLAFGAKKLPPPKKPATKSTENQFKLESRMFTQGQLIPRRYTGDGKDLSPPLNWSGVPKGTRQFVLIVDDPDAPSPKPWVHWVIYGLEAKTVRLKEGVPRQKILVVPHGAMQGLNSWQTIGYRGPKPPAGHGLHHYHFTLYALDKKCQFKPGLTKPQVLQKIRRNILAKSTLIGTYKR